LGVRMLRKVVVMPHDPLTRDGEQRKLR